MNTSSFYVESSGFSVYAIMSVANKDSVTSSFPIWKPFISSSCLTPMGRTSVLCWLREVKVDSPVLFLILRGTLIVFAHWVWCWQCICHIWPLLCLGMLPLFPHCWEFSSKMRARFYQMLSLHLLIWSCGFYPSFCLCG